MATKDPSIKPRPKRSTVAPKKHMTQKIPESKPVPRPVPKSHGPTQKSKPVPRGKLVLKPEPKVESRKQKLKRVPMPPQRIHRTRRSPNRTVLAKILSQFGYPANYRPPSPNGVPNPLYSPSGRPSPGRPSPGRNPLHSPHSPNEPPPGYLEQKKKNEDMERKSRSKRASNRTRIGTGF